MSLPFIIYLIGVSGNLAGCLVAIAIGGSISAGIAGLFGGLTYDDDTKALKAFVKPALIVALAAAVSSCLVPSSGTAYAMLAAYGVEEVAANEDVKRLSGKSLQLIESTIDKYLEATQEEK